MEGENQIRRNEIMNQPVEDMIEIEDPRANLQPIPGPGENQDVQNQELENQEVANPLLANVVPGPQDRRAEIQQNALEESLNRPKLEPKFSDEILKELNLLDLRVQENQKLSPNHLGVVYYTLDDDGKTVIYNQDKFAINGQDEIGEIKEIIKSNGVKSVSSSKKSWFGGKKYTRRVKHGSKTKKHFTSHLDNKKSLSKHKRRKTNRK